MDEINKNNNVVFLFKNKIPYTLNLPDTRCDIVINQTCFVEEIIQDLKLYIKFLDKDF